MAEQGISDESQDEKHSWVDKTTKSGLRLRAAPSRRELKLTLKQEQQRSEKFKELADHDFLTGVYSRRGILSEAERVKSVLEREEKYEGFTVVVADLIGLKALNEKLGESGADQLLVDSAQAFDIAASRGTDLVSRWGGDEFVLVLFNQNADTVDAFINIIKEIQPDNAKYNFGYRSFGKDDAIDSSIKECVNEIDKVKKSRPLDETGRVIGEGVVVKLPFNV